MTAAAWIVQPVSAMFRFGLVCVLAALPLATAAAAGPATIEVGDSARPLEVTLPAGRGPAPLAVLVHGWGVGPEDYRSHARELNAQGFATALFRAPSKWELDPHAWRDALMSDLDAVEAAAAPGGPLARVDVGRIGLIGHSLGGGTVVTTAAADPRVGAVVAYAPGTALQFRRRLLREARAITAPTLILSGGLDGIAPHGMFAGPLRRVIPGARGKLLPFGTHLDFSDRKAPFATPGAHDRQHARVMRETTQFLQRTLGARR